MRRTLRVGCTAAAALLFSACVTRELEPDFEAFSTAYARDMNWQMLLNLARLDQGHPAYFMAIGEIRIPRSHSVSLNTSGQSSHTEGQSVAGTVTRTVSNVLAGTLAPNVSASAAPTFIFIPINSEEATRQLLEPVSLEVFNTLYQQGWPVDQLLRVMVERIEADVEDPASGRLRHLVLTNSAPRAGADDQGESFARFLHACEMIRALQRAGALGLAIETNPEWTKYKAEQDAKSGAEAGVDKKGAASTARVGKAETKGPEPAHHLYRFVGQQEMFSSALAAFRTDDYSKDQSLENLLAVFRNSNLLVGSTSAPSENTRTNAPHAVLILRSFASILDAVAQEQRAVDALSREHPAVWNKVPHAQRRPILRTDWSRPTADEAARMPKGLLPPVASLKFAGRTYQVSDPLGDDATALDLGGRWNRDVFRLLVSLSTQVTVDITKFQRQVLELTQ